MGIVRYAEANSTALPTTTNPATDIPSACEDEPYASLVPYVPLDVPVPDAISLLNQGNYTDAAEHFQEILLQNNTADYAFYGLAIMASLTGSNHECLEHLEQAIKLNPMNRIHARGDSDFTNMADDPRFTDLLYPES